MPANVGVIGVIFQGTATHGQVIFSASNSWYAVPVTAPTIPYKMVVSQETAVGTGRWSYTNIGTPGTTSGVKMATTLVIDLIGGQVIYMGSSTNNDSVNYTLKALA
jgi:carbohydrate-selective porin OprB